MAASVAGSHVPVRTACEADDLVSKPEPTVPRGSNWSPLSDRFACDGEHTHCVDPLSLLDRIMMSAVEPDPNLNHGIRLGIPSPGGRRDSAELAVAGAVN
jgi:hypothetical protein